MNGLKDEDAPKIGKRGRRTSSKKVAPETVKKRVLITSALPYIHHMPHLGNLIGSLLPADVYSRYTKLAGYESIYICGSDAHGAMYEIEAEKQGKTPEKLVMEHHRQVVELLKKFNLDFTYYGTTHSTENKEVVNRIFEGLDKNGYIKEEAEQNAFCQNCKRFLQDRWVEGECPHCHGLARGDQCDDCGKLLSPKDILKPYCVHCKGPVIFKDTKHLYLQLQLFEKWLRGWLETGERKNWRPIPRNITLAWLDEGLKPRTITRDSSWGFSVPRKGYENKVYYVWFDAPIGYIGITKEWSSATGKPKEWERWWFDQSVRYVQFMGKDNVPFHSIMFPSFLQGSGEPWKQVDLLVASGWLLSKGGKFSKSRGMGLGMEEALSVRPADYWRFALISLYPETDDTEFTWEELQRIINTELADNIGNFIHRVLSYTKETFGTVPDRHILTEDDNRFLESLKSIKNSITETLEACRLRQTLREIGRFARECNAYLNEQEPWRKVKTDKARAETVINLCVLKVFELSLMLWPFIPEASEKVWKEWIGLGSIEWADGEITKEYPWNFKGLVLKNQKIEPLFRKIDDKELAQLKERFADKAQKPEEKGDAFADLDLRVGRIVSVEVHKDAEKLYVLQVDLGKETRQVVAGLRAHYTPEELLKKKIVVITNLEPAKLRGIESQGMLLAGDDGKRVGVLYVKDAEPGTPITASGIKQSPRKQVSFKDFQKIEIVVGKGGIYCGDKQLLAGSERVLIERVGEGARVR